MKKGKFLKLVAIATIAIIIVVSAAVYFMYNAFFTVCIDLKGKESAVIYISSGSTLEQVISNLKDNAGLISDAQVRFVAKHKGYNDKTIKPGRYRIKNKMSVNSLLNLLKSGNQEPVKLVFNSIRTQDEFCKKVSSQLEFQEDSLKDVLNSQNIYREYGFSRENFLTMFIPNTYEMFWTITPEKFVARMNKEYKSFWNDERKGKAAQISLSPVEVSILASIVEGETNKKSEMQTIAGLYINRLQRGMLLQADPTVKFALQDFTITRVLKRHLEYDSPYNTYIYPGLPPGPICMPEPSTIDAVLNYQKHDYIFMCAKDDFSGYHVFARNGAEHGINARKYQQALNLLRIR